MLVAGPLSVDSAQRYQLWVNWFITICAGVCLVFSESLHATEHKEVLIVHSVGREFKPWNEYAKQIRAELDRQSPWPLDVREHSLESARSADINPEAAFIAYLQTLHSGHAPDLIVAIGAPAANFIQRHRQRLFPTAPALFTAIEQRRIDHSSLTENDAIVVVKQDFRVLFESFLQISPDTKVVAVVIGSSPNEIFWRDEMKRELKPLEARIEIRFYDKFSLEDILKQTAALPAHSAIFWNQMAVDGAGVAHEGDSALTRIYATANAPIFTHDDAFFGREIIGGLMHSALAGSRTAAAVAVRILGGERAGEIKTPPADYVAPKYDWRELQRWGISESRLPPGSEVVFRDPPPWEKYPWQIALTCALILLQAGMISGLLYEHSRRQSAELQSRQRLAELARANRFATAGELTASIAHEINQPLGAIQTNVETMELMLKSPSPKIDEIREIAADIRYDQGRASEVIRRLRSLLRKAPYEIRDIDLSEIVRETEKFLSAFSAFAVDLSISTAPEPLPIRGDPIQLQQVILNLIVNAIDAMSEIPRAERKITIRTTRIRDLAEVSISDAGPGIPPDKLKEVFEPFFTTKAHGMGMGLSIVRTIVEAHIGQIVAENQTSGGVVFRVTLPLAKTNGNGTDA
jgi:signal transduction histidine kinase